MPYLHLSIYIYATCGKNVDIQIVCARRNSPFAIRFVLLIEDNSGILQQLFWAARSHAQVVVASLLSLFLSDFKNALSYLLHLLALRGAVHSCH